MKKSVKQEYILKLIIIALNEAINKGCIDLNGRSADSLTDNKKGHYELTILDKRTIINWFDIGYDELRVSVWWDYKPELMPTWRNQYLNELEPFTSRPQVPNRFFRYILGACGSCHLERRTGKFIIGDENNQFFDVYVREDSERLLKNAELAEPKGYQTHGWIKE